MRLFSLLASACVLFQLVSALPTPGRNLDNLNSREEAYGLSSRNAGNSDTLEARGKKYVPPAPPSITFRKGGAHDADTHFKALSLYSDKRKDTEAFHSKVVAEHMKSIPGAHSAEIINLAHSKGSVDPKIHITAQFKDVHGDIISRPRHGNGQLSDKVHVYIGNPDHHDSVHSYNAAAHAALPHTYKHAVAKHNDPHNKESAVHMF